MRSSWCKAGKFDTNTASLRKKLLKRYEGCHFFEGGKLGKKYARKLYQIMLQNDNFCSIKSIKQKIESNYYPL